MGAITPGSFNLDGPPLDSPLYQMDGVGDPAVTAGSSILVELTAYDFNAGATTVLRFGADGYNDPSGPGYFSPRMTQSLNFRRDMFSGNTTGGPSRVSYGELRLANDDGGLDTLRTQFAFAGWPATLYIGDVNQPFSTFEILITGKPQQAFFSFRDLSVMLRDRLQDFNQPVQTNKYLGDNILPDGLEGGIDFKDKPKPLLFGRVQNIQPPMVNTAKLVFQVNDGSVELIPNVYDQGVALTRGPDYTDVTAMMATQPDPGFFRCCMLAGYFRLGALPVGTVTCDASDRYFDTDTQRDVDNTAARVALRIASRPAESGEGGITDADINWLDVDLLDRANSSAVGIWVVDSATFGSCLDAVLSSIGAWYGFDRIGMFRMQRLQVPSGGGICTFKMFGPDVDAGWGDYDIIDVRFLPTNDPDRGVPAYEVKVNYGLNYTVQSKDNVGGAVSEDRKTFLGLQYRSATSTNPTLKNSYPLAMKKELNTLIIDATAAQTEANRLLSVYQGQRDFIEIDTPMVSDLIATVDIGSEVLVVLPRFNYYASPFSDAELYYNFMSGVYGALTTTRASNGWALNNDGYYVGFSANQPRITDKGLLVEEARTNRIRNNSMQGAVAGTPGTLPTNWTINDTTLGLTRTISFSIQNGVDYIEITYTGTPTATGTIQIRADPITQHAATSGQTWTYSVNVSNPVAAGVTNTRLAVLGADGIGSQTEAITGTTFTGDTAFTRRQLSITLAQVATTAVSADVRATFTIGVPANYTVRLGWPQLEFGPFATSPIRTTSAAVTRAADIVTVTTPPVFGSAFTIFGKATPLSPTNHVSNQRLITVDDGSANNIFTLQRNATNGQAVGSLTVAGVNSTLSSGVVWAQGASGTLAYGSTDSSQAVSFNGSAVVTSAVTHPGALTVVRIGTNSTNFAPANSYIECIAIWPTRRLSNIELERVTQAQTPTQVPRAGKSMLVTGMQYNPGTRGLTLSLWG